MGELPLLTDIEVVWIIGFILILLLAVVIAEIVVCILMALQFRVEELSGFYSRFLSYYKISVRRDTVSWVESKNNWFLWLSVSIGNVEIEYMPGYSVNSVISNIGSYFFLVLLTPFYFIFAVGSYFERIYRILLKPFVFICFWLLAKLKIIMTYYFKGTTLVVDSKSTDTVCSVDVIYRRPVIRILLHHPGEYPDSLQKDNLNHFTSTLRNLLPLQQYVKFRTEIVYPADVEEQRELPLTMSYLCANYAKLIHKKSKKEVSQ